MRLRRDARLIGEPRRSCEERAATPDAHPPPVAGVRREREGDRLVDEGARRADGPGVAVVGPAETVPGESVRLPGGGGYRVVATARPVATGFLAVTFGVAAAAALLASRPTAVNLRWAVERIMRHVEAAAETADLAAIIRADAERICDEDVEICLGIGRHGLPLLEKIAHDKNGATVNVLTHCNAGALATLNWGTATAPIYLAQQAGIDVHVWVDETRPRNQGSQLTAWELARNGVAHTLIVDNAGGHLMQHGLVDIVITGTDRTTRCGDVANKIGTYLKALAAFDNNIPFYVALPSTTIDWTLCDGMEGIPIEERDPHEVTDVRGVADESIATVRTAAAETPVSNFAFDVTPARLITGLITERGVCDASEAGLEGLFPEHASS